MVSEMHACQGSEMKLLEIQDCEDVKEEARCDARNVELFMWKRNVVLL